MYCMCDVSGDCSLTTRVGLDFVTILNFSFLILMKVSNFNLNHLVLAMLVYSEILSSIRCWVAEKSFCGWVVVGDTAE